MNKLEIKEGTRFGLLVYIKEGKGGKKPSGQKYRTLILKCDCGTIKEFNICRLINEKVISCGCLHKEKHNGSYTSIYGVWSNMKNRCYGINNPRRERYGGRGITVCDEWNSSFIVFREWALSNGYVKGYHLDRINNDKGYSPDNCRFAPLLISINNRSTTKIIMYEGKPTALADACREFGLDNKGYERARKRIDLMNWEGEQAVKTIPRTGNYGRNRKYK